MFENTKPRIGQELLDVPMGDMIRQMAFAIAEAQIVLDQNSIDVAEMMGGLTTVTDEAGNVTFEDSRVYFGTQKTNVTSAITIHNGTNNVQQKAEIRAALTQAKYTPVLDETPANFSPTGLASQLEDGTYIDYLGSYFVKVGTGTGATLVQKTYGEFQIEMATTASPDGEVLIPRRISMLECGFTPTFYQFVDTIIEVKISIKYTQDGSYNTASSVNNKSSAMRIGLGFGRLKAGKNVQIAQVNAGYSQKYSYSAEGSSLLRTKLVPLPPPAILEQRIQRLMEEEFTPPAE